MDVNLYATPENLSKRSNYQPPYRFCNFVLRVNFTKLLRRVDSVGKIDGWDDVEIFVKRSVHEVREH